MYICIKDLEVVKYSKRSNEVVINGFFVLIKPQFFIDVRRKINEGGSCRFYTQNYANKLIRTFGLVSIKNTKWCLVKKAKMCSSWPYLV